jgi:hypothetical protein
MKFKQRLFGFLWDNNYLMIALLVSAPLYLWNALKYSAPMGYAGLFTQMAQQVADANFLLPDTSPFYGPGGIPFAYPPFGIYFLAVLIKLTGKYYIFLRILPSLFSLFALIPLYYLAFQLSKSKIAAFLAVVITTSSIELYIAHTWAAGIVRAPAFLFSLAAIYFFLEELDYPSKRNIILAGIFFGLSILSHLAYALFSFLWFGWWSLFSQEGQKKIGNAVLISVIGFLIASPWIVTIITRHGIDVFFNAFGTHGGQSLFSSLFITPLQTFWANLEPIRGDGVLLIFVMLGVSALLAKRKYVFFSLSLFVVLAFPENIRFTFLISAIVAGMGLSFLGEFLERKTTFRFRSLITPVLLAFALIYFGVRSFGAFSAYTPLFDGYTLELSDYVQESTVPNDVYLALFRQDEAEWLPFMFQREPLVAQWGSEWIGTYNKQSNLMSIFRSCQKEISWACVQAQFGEMQRVPDFLVTYAIDRKLNEQISEDHGWQEIYANKRYILWRAVETAPQE